MFCYGNVQEKELHNSLLVGYKKSLLPLVESKKINVSIGIAIRAINNVNQLDGTIKFNMWVRYRWQDEYLIWNKSITDQLTFTTDPGLQSSIWIPDIYIYNTADNPMSQLAYTHAIVYPSGDVLLSRPGMITSTCSFNLSDFPYDQQFCSLKFGSWAYSSKRMNLHEFIPAIDISNYQHSHEWDLIYFNTTINEKYYSCCADAYQDITFNILIRRKTGYFSQNIILPAFTTPSLMILSLFIPWNSPARISFATTVMLTMTVYLLILSEHLPQTNTNPLLSTMFIGLTMLAFIGLFFTILFTSFHSHGQYWNQRIVCFQRYLRRNTIQVTNQAREIGEVDIHKVTNKIEHYFTFIFILAFIIFSSVMYSKIPVYDNL